MDRKEFIKTCSMGCLGMAVVTPLIQSCAGARMITVDLVGEQLILPVSEFEILKKEKKEYRPYIIVQNPKLQYPIAVYRHGEGDYNALLMRCTHQGTELRAFGSKLQCPAHGSEFGNNGEVNNGPADEVLRKFPVTLENGQLKISLI
jgi:Rieske Fe-S protein